MQGRLGLTDIRFAGILTNFVPAELTAPVPHKVKTANQNHWRWNHSNTFILGCYGGYARVKEVVDQTRPNHKDSLLLNAGDEFQVSAVTYSVDGAK